MDNQVEKNKAIAKVFFDELYNKGNLDAIEKFLDSNVTVQKTFPWQRKGIKAFNDTIEILKPAFPDLKIKFGEILGEGDKVICAFTVKGTHKESFLNMPATNRNVEYEEVNILKFRDEKIIEHHVIADTYNLMQQITGIELNNLV